VVDDALAADGAEGVLVLDGVEVALVPVDVEVVLAPVDVEGVFAAERSALGSIVDQLRWLGWAKDDYVLEMPRSTINTVGLVTVERGRTPGPAVANQKGRSGLVSRRAGYYTKCFGAHDGDSFFLSSAAEIRTRTQTRTVVPPARLFARAKIP
jgi:hypothetical protein